MIIDGRAIARDILAAVQEEIKPLLRSPIVRAVVVAPTGATESYLSVKRRAARRAGMTLEVVELSASASEQEIIDTLNAPGADALLVQLPLPRTLPADRILNSIPLHMDADILSDAAYEVFSTGSDEALLPPVVASIEEILIRSEISLKDKRAVVVGSGRLVGEPAALWLKQKGALVSVITRDSGDEGFEKLKNAEIVVSGAGAPRILRPEHFTQGVVLIDAGTSESGGAIVGDATPECADIASLFTPVPGGVGPIAVACLFQNVASLIKRHGLQEP